MRPNEECRDLGCACISIVGLTPTALLWCHNPGVAERRAQGMRTFCLSCISELGSARRIPPGKMPLSWKKTTPTSTVQLTGHFHRLTHLRRRGMEEKERSGRKVWRDTQEAMPLLSSPGYGKVRSPKSESCQCVMMAWQDALADLYCTLPPVVFVLPDVCVKVILYLDVKEYRSGSSTVQYSISLLSSSAVSKSCRALDVPHGLRYVMLGVGGTS
ncbi:hypothetical protein H4582DRAFT_203522 [Lactarius indigo]|nr:hypothetical protein H4582DRAFT_203522 [Lactarius indigo]